MPGLPGWQERAVLAAAGGSELQGSRCSPTWVCSVELCAFFLGRGLGRVPRHRCEEAPWGPSCSQRPSWQQRPPGVACSPPPATARTIDGSRVEDALLSSVKREGANLETRAKERVA